MESPQYDPEGLRGEQLSQDRPEPDEAARRHEAGDEEHIDLTNMVKHQVRFIDRGEPPC